MTKKTKIVLDADVIIHFTKAECDIFIQEVVAKGSKLPNVDISTYVPTAHL